MLSRRISFTQRVERLETRHQAKACRISTQNMITITEMPIADAINEGSERLSLTSTYASLSTDSDISSSTDAVVSVSLSHLYFSVTTENSCRNCKSFYISIINCNQIFCNWWISIFSILFLFI